MPQATYIRGTQFDSYWFEIKEFVVGKGKLFVVMGMEYQIEDADFHEKMVMKTNSMFVAKEKVGLDELMSLSGYFDAEGFDKNLNYLMCLVVDDEMLVVGKGGEVYLLRGDRKGYILRQSEKVEVKKGKMKEGDRVFVGLGESSDETIISLFSKEGLGKIEKNLSSPCCGILLEYEEEMDEKIETKIDIEKPKKEVLPKPKARSRAWEKWKDYLTKKIDTANPEVYVKGEERKRLGKVVLLVFLLLVLSVGIGWRKRKADEKNETFKQIYEPSLQLLIEAEDLASENALESREKLIEARNKIEEILNDFSGDEKEKEKLSTLLSQANELYEQVSGEHKLEEATLFYDLSLIKEDVYGEEMSLADGWITILDKSRGVVLGVEEESKKGKLLAGGEILRGAKYLASSGGKAVALSDEGLVGIYYNDRTAEALLETDEEWKEIVGIGMFGGNVYVVDSETSEIWRYPGFEGGVGSGVRWLGPGVSPDFSGLSSIAVDGDIWMATAGRIRRFRRGAQMNFSIDGLVDSLAGIEAIYTDTDSESVYILDRENARVVVVNKEGEYQKQYIWSGIKAVSDMVVVEKDGGGIILLLSGSSIYQIEIEN